MKAILDVISGIIITIIVILVLILIVSLMNDWSAKKDTPNFKIPGYYPPDWVFAAWAPTNVALIRAQAHI